MSPIRQILLVAARDFRERVMSRAFQLSTGFTVLIVAGLMLVPSFLGDDAPEWDVGFVGSPPAGLDSSVETASGDPELVVTVVTLADTDAAEAALRSGDVDVVIDGPDIVASEVTGQALLSTVAALVGSEAAAARAAELGLSADDMASLLRSAAPEIRRLDPQDETDDSTRVMAFAAMILLFISIVTYGQWILVGVIEEKSSRVVEVVLGAIKPSHLLAGKVLGIGALGLAQLVLVGGLALVLGSRSTSIEIPDTAATAVLAVIMWFFLGFAFYATAYAAAGSLVTRQEEAQNAAFPLTMVLMAAYFIASFSITEGGDNTVLRVASLLPPTAPMTMPVRMATGDAPAWEVLVAIAAMVAAIALLLRLAARIYAGGLLRSGGRVKLTEAWRAARR